MKYEQPERIFLAQTPTPIESLDELIPGTTILVKRDDLTGTLLSGNKIRKLEFLLAEAKTLEKKTNYHLWRHSIQPLQGHCYRCSPSGYGHFALSSCR